MKSYKDYGDITGTQLLRRFIENVNKHFEIMNGSVNEVIRVVNEVIDMVEGLDGAEVTAELEKLNSALKVVDTKVKATEADLIKIDDIFTKMASEYKLFNTEMGVIVDTEMKEKKETLSAYVEQLKAMPK